MIEAERIYPVLRSALAEGRSALLETEGLQILDAMGIPAPAFRFVRSARESVAIEPLPGQTVVVKVISSEILHKSDVGGVEIVSNNRESIRAAITEMEQQFSKNRVAGFTIHEFVPYDRSLGNELLVGVRWTEDFGAVVTLGPGGVYTEFLASRLRHATVIVSVDEGEDIELALSRSPVMTLNTGRLRGQPARISTGQMVDILLRLSSLARIFSPHLITDFEINPLVIHHGSLLALDVLVKLGTGVERHAPPPRPISKLKALLEPRSVALFGVSERMNPGHVILGNLLREGFPRDRIHIVKPGTEQIDGCRCYPRIADLPEKVDLAVLVISAPQVPAAIEEMIELQAAESVIIIPGGLDEKEGGQAIVDHMRDSLLRSRATPWRGPLLNGGNCLGIRSRPGRYDTMFIPQYKLPSPTGPSDPVAILSQSGAFAIARWSKFPTLAPKYMVSLGNQMDLTVGDYLGYLRGDREIEVFAVYMEGFRPGDGLAFVKTAREIVAEGRTVILYRSGRTAAGARASASHTASIAGDYAVTRELAERAGVVVAESIEDFEDLLRLFVLLRGKHVGGWRLGAVSNAGFECVAFADNIGSFEMKPFAADTVGRLREILRRARLDEIVDVHNPLDITPIMADAGYEEAVAAVLRDPGVDVGIIGCVPPTPAVNTLPAGPGHSEDLLRPDGIVHRLARLAKELPMAWVAVVDSGPLYDPMARELESHGIPTFRAADRALRLFNRFCAARLHAKAED